MSSPVPRETPSAAPPADDDAFLRSGVALLAWVLVPLLLGAGWAFVTFAYAAHRRNSGWLWLSAIAYGVMATTYVYGSVLFDPSLRPFDWIPVLATVHAAVFARHLVMDRRLATGRPAVLRNPDERALSAWHETLRLRRVAREVIARNPQQALDMGIGRPDLAGVRAYPDGGLVDVNNVSAAVLGEVLGLIATEADELVRVRWDVGGVAGVDDLSILMALAPQRLDTVAARLVFLPLLPSSRPT